MADVPLELHTCATHGCGVAFWLPVGFADRRRQDKQELFCPNGHSLVYGGKTDKEKLLDLQREVHNGNMIRADKDAEIERLNRKLKRCANKKNHGKGNKTA